MFEQEIYNLCEKREVFVPLSRIVIFEAECQEKGIIPRGCIILEEGNILNPLKESSRQYRLFNTITLEEARVIADFKNLVGSFDYWISHGKTPWDALGKLGLTTPYI